MQHGTKLQKTDAIVKAIAAEYSAVEMIEIIGY